MTDKKPVEGPQHAFSRSDVIVSLKHMSRVRQALHDFVLPIDEDEDLDVDLGLARLRIPRERLAAAQQHFASCDPRPPGETSQSETSQGAAELPENVLMDSLLRGLRAYFRQEYAGWAPLIGKNRLVGSVIGGGGKVSHGGGGPLRKPLPGERLADRVSDTPEGWRGLGAGVRVAVLDTALAANDWYAGAWTTPADEVYSPAQGEPARPEAGHGTFVAGLVLEQAPACTIISRRVLDANGEAELWDVARAVVRVARTRPDVINLSFVCFTEDGEAPFALASAIDRVDPDTVIVAAAGNHGDLLDDDEAEEVTQPGRKPAWPAAFDRVVAVGSSGFDGKRSPFTPRRVDWIDAYAPGEELLSTFLQGLEVDPSGVETRSADPDRDEAGVYDGLARWSGSSFSAASVSGAIAARIKPGRTSARSAWEELAGDQVQRLTQDPGRPVFIGPPLLSYSWRSSDEGSTTATRPAPGS